MEKKFPRRLSDHNRVDRDTKIMPEVLIDLVFALFMSVGGMLAGWGLRRKLRQKASRLGDEPRIAHEVLGRLQELAHSMAANVGEHSSRVEEINQELSSAEGHEPEVVVSVVAKLIQANQQMQHQLSTVEDKLHEQAQMVASSAAEARTDALTGLPNRRAFDDELARCFAQANREHKSFSLLMGDIDHFKRFNDTHGHQAGDEVLRGVARVLRTIARSTDVVARYGGEEFAIILPKTCIAETVERLEEIRRGIETARFRSSSHELHVTMSFGASQSAADEEAADLIRRADTALYASKASGRNCGYWHDGHGIRPILGATPPASKTPREMQQPKPSQVAKPKPATRSPMPVAGGSGVPAARHEPARSICGRSEFCTTLNHRIAEWRRGGSAPAILLVRIDHYAELVARGGSEVGELVIRGTAQYLHAAVREMDVAGEFDEGTFAMLLPGTSLAAAIGVAQRLRDAIARSSLPMRGVPLQFTVSVAGTTALQGDETGTILQRAQQCLRSAAKAGGNCTFFHDGRQPEPAEFFLEHQAAS